MVYHPMTEQPIVTNKAHYTEAGVTLCGKTIPAHAAVERAEPTATNICRSCAKKLAAVTARTKL